MAIASWSRPSARATSYTRTLHDAFQAAVTVSMSLCGIPFRAASKGKKQTKGMLGNLFHPIERTREAAKTPGEKSAKKRQIIVGKK